jgi:hypothetical protein
MSDAVAGLPEPVVPFAPKPIVKSEAGDQLDRAAQAILTLVQRAGRRSCRVKSAASYRDDAPALCPITRR